MAKQLATATLFDLKVEQRAITSLTPYPRNARVHSRKQIALLSAAISRFGFLVPVLVDSGGGIVAGHGRIEAAKALGMDVIPVIALGHLTEAEQRAFIIADNRLAELAGWDADVLSLELQDLAAIDLDFELELTGFDGAELDELLGVDVTAKIDPEADDIPEAIGPPISRVGDVWILGKHRLVCGDARDPAAYEQLMAGEQARMVFTDPPYNVRVVGNVSGKGKNARREFVMASGEMTAGDFTTFLTESLTATAAVSQDGSIHFVCMDWRHLSELLTAGTRAYAELKNVVVWAKTNGGMGAFYRSAHELVFVFKRGAAPHLNTFGLGATGRYRTNVWSYPGVNSFRAGRETDLALHPTVKPVAMVADAIRDVSHRGDIVLDAFGGSGTTLIAAEKSGRRARLLELDPLYVDVICRRWAKFAKTPATLEETCQTFDEVAEARDVHRQVGGHG